MAELHGAAGGVEAIAVIVIAGYYWRNRLQMRIVEQRNFPLRDAEIRSADHADLAVGPGLGGKPVERVVAIRPFLRKRTEAAFGSIAAAHVLQHEGIAMIDEWLIAERQVRALPVRGANQDSRHAAFDVRPKYVGRESNAVTHGDACVEALQDWWRERGGRQARGAKNNHEDQRNAHRCSQ